MEDLVVRRGTRNATPRIIVESGIVLVSATEAILLAALALRLSRLENAEPAAVHFVRLATLLAGPFEVVPIANLAIRQAVAMVTYGALLAALLLIMTWFERSRALS